MSLPNRLRVVDGQLVMADGSDVRDYLRAWAIENNIGPEEPITLQPRKCADRQIWDERFALAG